MLTGQNYASGDPGANESSLTVESDPQAVDTAVLLNLPLLAATGHDQPTARLVYWAINNYLDRLINDQADMLKARAYRDAAITGRDIQQLAEVQASIEASVQCLLTAHPKEYVEWANHLPVADEE